MESATFGVDFKILISDRDQITLFLWFGCSFADIIVLRTSDVVDVVVRRQEIASLTLLDSIKSEWAGGMLASCKLHTRDSMLNHFQTS